MRLFTSPVIAHRGASAYAPENTLSAFRKAYELGIPWVEFDVMLTADHVPIVFHDDLLDRTTNGSGEVGRYSFPELQMLDAGSWFNQSFSGEKIPALNQVIKFLKEKNMAANVEIKPLPGQDIETVDRALDIILPVFPELSPSILYSSFSVTSLRQLRKRMPRAWIGLLLHEWESGWEDVAKTLNCQSVHVYESILTAEKAKKIKEMGKLLLSYTVNDPDRARELYSWGVDAVFSDTCLSG